MAAILKLRAGRAGAANRMPKLATACGYSWPCGGPLRSLLLIVIREKRHRLPATAYRGNVIVAFTICTDLRKPFFLHAQHVDIASTALAEAFAQHHGQATVYLFMPDHCHLIVSGRDSSSDLLALVSLFKQKTTFRMRMVQQGFGWQKDFYDHIIRANEDYGAQIRYVLRNPVRKGLCLRWEDWPHKGVLGQTWEQLALNIGSL